MLSQPLIGGLYLECERRNSGVALAGQARHPQRPRALGAGVPERLRQCELGVLNTAEMCRIPGAELYRSFEQRNGLMRLALSVEGLPETVSAKARYG